MLTDGGAGPWIEMDDDSVTMCQCGVVGAVAGIGICYSARDEFEG